MREERGERREGKGADLRVGLRKADLRRDTDGFARDLHREAIEALQMLKEFSVGFNGESAG